MKRKSKKVLTDKQIASAQRKRIMAMRASISRDGSDKIDPDAIMKAVCEVLLKPCIYCGVVIDFDNVSADHKKSLAHGGTSSLDNIEFQICKSCNRVKGAFDSDVFLKLLNYADSLGVKKELMTRLKTGIMIFGRRH
jgi:5-methylcytosine-specific restriction endonuclease McrA